MVKTFITLAHGGKIKYPVIYSRVLTLDNVGTAVNFYNIGPWGLYHNQFCANIRPQILFLQTLD